MHMHFLKGIVADKLCFLFNILKFIAMVIDVPVKTFLMVRKCPFAILLISYLILIDHYVRPTDTF